MSSACHMMSSCTLLRYCNSCFISSTANCADCGAAYSQGLVIHNLSVEGVPNIGALSVQQTLSCESNLCLRLVRIQVNVGMQQKASSGCLKLPVYRMTMTLCHTNHISRLSVDTWCFDISSAHCQDPKLTDAQNHIESHTYVHPRKRYVRHSLGIHYNSLLSAFKKWLCL